MPNTPDHKVAMHRLAQSLREVRAILREMFDQTPYWPPRAVRAALRQSPPDWSVSSRATAYITTRDA